MKTYNPIEMYKEDRDFVVKDLYNVLKHGDAEHSAWLYDAIYAYFHDQPVPPVRGSGNKEAVINTLKSRIVELESQINDFYWKSRENATTSIFD